MGKPQATMDETLAAIRAECLGSWAGVTGERRARDVRDLLDRVLPQYAAALGISEFDMLTAIETQRNYSAVNYYQDAKFPTLVHVTLFDTMADFHTAFPSRKYVCPACEGHSKNPYECDAGTVRDGKPCNWKSYGFFGTMGKGLRVVVKDKFLESPGVHEIFMPIERVQMEPA